MALYEQMKYCVRCGKDTNHIISVHKTAEVSCVVCGDLIVDHSIMREFKENTSC
jgi:DNA-directed RNA polymerase subunit RPC12/RpoP